MGVGTSELGNVLSFGSVVYGYASGWTSYAADYTVYQPPTQPSRKVFLWTYLGLIFPVLFVELLSVAIATATTIDDGHNQYTAGYQASHTGGVLAAVLIHHLGGFGKFCLVLLALSIVANNCPNVYSVGIAAQALTHHCRKIPRYVWTLLATGIYIGIAIPGYSHFETVLQSFLTFIGYWIAIYTAIAVTDHVVWKRGMKGYDIAIHENANKLPLGLAATFSFCLGVSGMILGMSQVWYVGPIALKAGMPPFGGDVGFELGFAFAMVGYLVTRPLELKYFGR